MIKKLSSVLAISSLMALPMSQALAADSPWSVGVAVGSAKTDVSGINADIATVCATAGFSCDESDTGYKLYGGYKVNNNFTVELAYVDLGKVSIKDAGVDAVTLKNSGLAAYGMFSYPIDKASLFAKVGFSRLNTDANDIGVASYSDTKTNFAWGLGASYALTDNVGVNLVWDRFKPEFTADGADLDTNADLISVGLSYSF